MENILEESRSLLDRATKRLALSRGRRDVAQRDIENELTVINELKILIYKLEMDGKKND